MKINSIRSMKRQPVSDIEQFYIQLNNSSQNQKDEANSSTKK